MDVDRLRADEAREMLLGLDVVPGHRRLGEYLARFDDESVKKLSGVAHAVAKQVAPEVIAHEIEEKGYVPVFVDGTAIEVTGEQYENARAGYNEELQYWLHGVFIGRMWASERLYPGGVDVASGWREQLDETAQLLGDCSSVWLRADNAYYRKDVIKYCREKEWDFSISVTNETYKQPLREKVALFLAEEDWIPINDDLTEDAAIIYHRPSGWEWSENYVVVRSMWDGPQKRIEPRYTFILVSRTDP